MAQPQFDKNKLKDLLTRAVDEHQAGRIDSAMEKYKEVLKDVPENFVANQFYGAALNQKGKFRESLPYYKKALRSKPDWELTYVNYINALIQLKRYREALQVVEDGLKQVPNPVGLYTQKAKCLNLNGRPQDAAKASQLALSKDPKNKEALLNKEIGRAHV